MKNVQIQAIKVGSVVNISLNGKLHKKNCGSAKEADELFHLVLKAKETPSDENINDVKRYLNEKLRVAFLAGLESDLETGEIFLEGFNTPIPNALVEVIKDYHEHGYPMTPVMNFWKLLMINPDKRVRISLFDFISTHDFVLTDKGYMVVYKAVYDFPNEKKSVLGEFVSNQFLHVKKDWLCSPNKYTVYKDCETGNYAITKNKTVEGWGIESNGDLNIEVLGKLGDLYKKIFVDGEIDEVPVYTDIHTQSMRIVLGQPVLMDRKKCNGDPAVECSYGLHVGSTKYVTTFGGDSKSVLVCFVNPANVVAVPEYDNSKMRVSEYFPFALASFNDGKIDIIEQKYFESDYQQYEEKQLFELIKKVKKSEKPFEKAINTEEEDRPMSELQKIIDSRLIDLVG
jgi:hypothetical protein